ncbi:MAG TPA: cytochrome c [Thermoanaerobaculia bacterium]|nr:cytochrome c [Thermoanaerobaculia bacterium]
MNRRLEGGLQVLVLASATVLAALWPMGSPTSSAEEVIQPPAHTYPTGSIARGRVSYRLYCASCHGQTAQGDGPVAQYLKTKPVDLTKLAAGNSGKFPAEQVFASIDGRGIEVTPTHGPRDMPVWGLSFQDPAKDTDQEADAQQKIADIVTFVQSVQK